MVFLLLGDLDDLVCVFSRELKAALCIYSMLVDKCSNQKVRKPILSRSYRLKGSEGVSVTCSVGVRNYLCMRQGTACLTRRKKKLRPRRRTLARTKTGHVQYEDDHPMVSQESHMGHLGSVRFHKYPSIHKHI